MKIRKSQMRFIWLVAIPLIGCVRTQAQEPSRPTTPTAEGSAEADTSSLDGIDQTLQLAQAKRDRNLGTISGQVVDQTGVPVIGARVKLTTSAAESAKSQDADGSTTQTNGDGIFSFLSVIPGSFRIEIAQDGFATQVASGTLRPGEAQSLPRISLAIATAATEVIVTPSTFEVAEQQLKEQEKQRVIGVFPNFYVTYVRDAAPLSPKQKFELAWKSTIDPVNLAINGVIAGAQQAHNDFEGYGQGAQGYAKRYGASFADSATETFVGGAILPSLLKQDPRYFYKGSGTKKSRLMYALATAVICKGDNGRWQPNYSSILGNLAAGGISNLYYPAEDRNGFGLTMETALIGLGATAATNVLQEFVMRRFTPGLKSPDPIKDSPQAVPRLENMIAKLFPKPGRSGD